MHEMKQYHSYEISVYWYLAATSHLKQKWKHHYLINIFEKIEKIPQASVKGYLSYSRW